MSQPTKDIFIQRPRDTQLKDLACADLGSQQKRSKMDCQHNQYHVLEAHPRQRLEDADAPDTFNVAEEWQELECRCDDCDKIFWLDSRN